MSAIDANTVRSLIQVACRENPELDLNNDTFLGLSCEDKKKAIADLVFVTLLSREINPKDSKSLNSRLSELDSHRDVQEYETIRVFIENASSASLPQGKQTTFTSLYNKYSGKETLSDDQYLELTNLSILKLRIILKKLNTFGSLSEQDKIERQQCNILLKERDDSLNEIRKKQQGQLVGTQSNEYVAIKKYYRPSKNEKDEKDVLKSNTNKKPLLTPNDEAIKMMLTAPTTTPKSILKVSSESIAGGDVKTVSFAEKAKKQEFKAIPNRPTVDTIKDETWFLETVPMKELQQAIQTLMSDPISNSMKISSDRITIVKTDSADDAQKFTILWEGKIPNTETIYQIQTEIKMDADMKGFDFESHDIISNKTPSSKSSASIRFGAEQQEAFPVDDPKGKGKAK